MRLLKAMSVVVLLICCQLISNAQNITLTCPSNIIIKADAGKEGAVVSFSSLTLAPDWGSPTYTPASGSFFRLGSTSVTLATTSGQKCSFTVTVTDNEPPTLTELSLSTERLWPASNKMKKVGVYYTASDNTENVKSVVTVSSNSETLVDDWEIVNEHLVRLKASRLPDGEPRIYTITVTATDEAGNKTTRATTIAVSKTMISQ